MRQSLLFTKTRKESPKDETSINAQLLLRGGFVHKEMAGAYSFLPLGLRVLQNIARIVREEMGAIGGQEIQMTVLQDPEIWKTTGRWSDDVVDNWFKTSLNKDIELGLGFSHEEPLVRILTPYITSYRDLPKAVYQIQTKFRRELRAKSGILRGREFLMKDMYSFGRTQEELEEFYERCSAAYMRIFSRCGLGQLTFRTFASGGVFSKYSDEFQTICPSGEDTIYLHREKKMAVNREVFNDDVLADLGLNKAELEEVRAIEVGNIFRLGTRYSEPLGLSFTDEKSQKHPVIMGCYGIGISRLMGTVVEALADDRGIVWPEAIAPFTVHLLQLGDVDAQAAQVYENLTTAGIAVLWDDRDLRPGEKFADADLLGIPHRLVVSEKTGKKVEYKSRQANETAIMTLDESMKKITTART